MKYWVIIVLTCFLMYGCGSLPKTLPKGTKIISKTGQELILFEDFDYYSSKKKFPTGTQFILPNGESYYE